MLRSAESHKYQKAKPSDFETEEEFVLCGNDNPAIVEIRKTDITKQHLERYGSERLSAITCLFFDYDRIFTEQEDPTEQLTKTHHKEIKDKLLGYSSYRHPIVMTEAVQPRKVSFHVIFTNPKDAIIKADFRKEDEQELFSKIVGAENFKYIDETVYQKKRWFRLPYGKSHDKPYAHIPFWRQGNPEPPLRDYTLSLPDDYMEIHDDVTNYDKCPSRLNRQFDQLRQRLVRENTHPIELEASMIPRLTKAFKAVKLERFQDRKQWFVLGCMLKHFGQTFDLFCVMSRDSGYTKYSETDCRKQWDKLPEWQMNLGTLVNWLKADGVDYIPLLWTKTELAKKEKREQTKLKKQEKAEIKNQETESEEKEYQDWKLQFEVNHAKVIEPDARIVCKDSKSQWVFTTKFKLKEMYSHLTGYFNYIDRWWFDTEIRCFSRADIYSPSEECPSDVFNLWVNYPSYPTTEANEATMNQCLYILNHIKILCGNDDIVYQYVLSWIGQFIQYPHVKTTGLFFASKQGAGKDSLLHLIKRLVGNRKIYETTRTDDVFGRFNSALLNCSLVVLNEVDASDTSKYDGGMKTLITEHELPIEGKGIDPFIMRSFHRLIGFTNKTNYPVQTSEDDRRKLIIRCSDEKLGNTVYFSELYSYMDDNIVMGALFNYFNKLDVEEFNKKRGMPLPKTTYQKIITESYSDPIEDWILDIASSEEGENEVLFSGAELHTSWTNYTRSVGIKLELSLPQLGTRITLLGDKIKGITKKHTKKGVQYVFNKTEINNLMRRLTF